MVTEAIKSGYKLTEVGVIPEDWNVDAIENVAKVFRGGSPRPIEQYMTKDVNGVNWIKIGDVMVSSKYILSTKEKIIPDGVSFSRYVKNGDLLLSNSMSFGRPYILKIDGCIHDGWLVIQDYNSAFNRDFLYYILGFNTTLHQYKSLAAGSGVLNLKKEIVNKVLVQYPSIPEQKAIAQALSETDEFIAQLDKLIEKQKNIKKGAMQNLLTGKKRLPGFSGSWEEKELGKVGEFSGAGVDKTINPGETPVRLVNFLDVFRNDFIYSNMLNHWVTAPVHKAVKCAVKKGDLFFTPSSEMRTDIGLSAVSMEDIPDATYSYHVTRFRLFDDWDIKFSTYVFNGRYFLNQAETVCEGSGKRYVINMSKFKELKIKYPKDKKEQEAIGNILFDIDTEIKELEMKRDKYKMIKDGMMQQLLTGKVRLKWK